jgi:hypothetical protein
MNIFKTKQQDGTTVTIVATIPTEDIIVKSSVDYIPEYVTEVYGKTRRVTKDITLAKLLRLTRREFPDYELVSIGTPVNFDHAPTHLTRVVMKLKNEAQVEACLKEISVSDMMIRLRVQPGWDWKCPMKNGLNVMLHVGWYDTVYFMQFKDVFFGDLHCRYSAKFGFNPRQAKVTHFRYTDTGDLEELKEFNEKEKYAESIKDKVEFLRVFRDGTTELT